MRPTGINDYGVVVNPFNPDVATPILDPSWQVRGMNPLIIVPDFSLIYVTSCLGYSIKPSIYFASQLCASGSGTSGSGIGCQAGA